MYGKGKSENTEDLHVSGIQSIVIKHLPVSMDNLSTFWGNMPNFLGSYLRWSQHSEASTHALLGISRKNLTTVHIV